jgi:predicted enzyme related to lactoylglutathione lyase
MLLEMSSSTTDKASESTSMKQKWSPPSFGTPAWISIPATDVARAKAFYETVFGWEHHDAGKAEYPPDKFAMFLTPTPILMAGIIKVENRSDSPAQKGGDGVVVYMSVADLDATFEKVKSAGGSVVEGVIAEGKHTLRGKIADTEGNLIGVLHWVKGEC